MMQSELAPPSSALNTIKVQLCSDGYELVTFLFMVAALMCSLTVPAL